MIAQLPKLNLHRCVYPTERQRSMSRFQCQVVLRHAIWWLYTILVWRLRRKRQQIQDARGVYRGLRCTRKQRYETLSNCPKTPVNQSHLNCPQQTDAAFQRLKDRVKNISPNGITTMKENNVVNLSTAVAWVTTTTSTQEKNARKLVHQKKQWVCSKNI